MEQPLVYDFAGGSSSSSSSSSRYASAIAGAGAGAASTNGRSTNANATGRIHKFSLEMAESDSRSHLQCHSYSNPDFNPDFHFSSNSDGPSRFPRKTARLFFLWPTLLKLVVVGGLVYASVDLYRYHANGNANSNGNGNGNSNNSNANGNSNSNSNAVIPEVYGALVHKIYGKSPVHLGGLREQDIIQQIGSEPVRSASDASKWIDLATPGDNIPFTILRNGHVKVINVKPKDMSTTQREMQREKERRLLDEKRRFQELGPFRSLLRD